jgi:hypothetical protein
VLRTSSLRSRSLARKQRQQQSPREIDAIVEAIRKRDSAAARKAAMAHVESAAQSAFEAGFPVTVQDVPPPAKATRKSAAKPAPPKRAAPRR